mmetsp:Transcript_149488/g.380100  ORF Transcript_149488/g.380100 Transcript_149488/m.380100 type:complete len:200 (+) Transcript_149488:1721-2320(+)
MASWCTAWGSSTNRCTSARQTEPHAPSSRTAKSFLIASLSLALLRSLLKPSFSRVRTKALRPNWPVPFSSMLCNIFSGEPSNLVLRKSMKARTAGSSAGPSSSMASVASTTASMSALLPPSSPSSLPWPPSLPTVAATSTEADFSCSAAPDPPSSSPPPPLSETASFSSSCGGGDVDFAVDAVAAGGPGSSRDDSSKSS